MAYAVEIILGILTLISALAVGYWQYVYKPRRAEVAKPSHGDRAIDELFAEKERLQRAIDSERVAHGVTRTEYVAVVTRLATVEAELKAARRDVRDRDAVIDRLREDLADVRREIAEMRRYANED